MKEHSEDRGGLEALREKIIGLGDLSIKKSYYPQLQKRLTELEKFRSIMDQTNEGIFVLEIPSGKIIDINSSACCHLNCNRESMHSVTIFERKTPLALKIGEFIKSNDLETTLEIGLKNYSPESITIEANLKKIMVGDNSYVLILTRDITKRKRLQEEKETLIAISEIFLHSESPEIIYEKLLPLLLERLGFSLLSLEMHDPETDSFSVASASDSKSPIIHKKVPRNMEIITEKVFTSEKPFVQKGDIKFGKIFHPILKDADINTIVCAPMMIDDKVSGVILLASPHIRNDIDSVFQTVQMVGNHLAQEIKRKSTEEKLMERNRDLRNFADRVSHNLRSSLSIISGYITIVNEEPELISEYYNKIESQLKKMSRFVDRVLELSVAGNRIREKTPVQLSFLAESTFREQKEGIPSRLVLPSSLPEIFADHQGMRQVFHNLFSNSFKYRDENKEILIITITYQIAGDSIIISFRDNGSGLSAGDLTKVFDIGMSGKPGETTGFGLSIVKKIIESHGGAVRASSEGKGMGTEIRIILPDVLVPGQNIQ